MKTRSILITGASRGLGSALARAYSGPNIHLILTARSISTLAIIKAQCEEKGAIVTLFSLDLEKPGSINDLLASMKGDDCPDLVIANAGVFSGRHSERDQEPINQQIDQFSINLLGTVRLVDGLAIEMKNRCSGQIALVSSLAALQPSPDSPAYSASKAGLAVWGRAMRDDLADYNVKISIIYPGHIETDQTAIHHGALPGIIKPEQAAAIIQKKLARNRAKIAFPFKIYALIQLSNCLPEALRRYVNRPFRYHVDETDSKGTVS